MATAIGYGEAGGSGDAYSLTRGGQLFHGSGTSYLHETQFIDGYATAIGFAGGVNFDANGTGGSGVAEGIARGGAFYQAATSADPVGYEHHFNAVSFNDNSAFGLGIAIGIGGGDQGASDVLQFGVNQLLIGGNISPWPGYDNGPVSTSPLFGLLGGYPYDIPSGGAGQAYARAYGVGEGGGAFIAGGDTYIEESYFGQSSTPDEGNSATGGAVALAFGQGHGVEDGRGQNAAAVALAGNPGAHGYCDYETPYAAGGIGRGGGLYQAGGDLYLKNTEVYENTARAFGIGLAIGDYTAYGVGGSEAYGGGVFQTGGDVTLTGVSFDSNSAISGGSLAGAINDVLGGNLNLPLPTLGIGAATGQDGVGIGKAFADAGGGALYAGGAVQISAVDMTNNRAEANAYALGIGAQFQLYDGGLPGLVNFNPDLIAVTGNGYGYSMTVVAGGGLLTTGDLTIHAAAGDTSFSDNVLSTYSVGLGLGDQVAEGHGYATALGGAIYHRGGALNLFAYNGAAGDLLFEDNQVIATGLGLAAAYGAAPATPTAAATATGGARAAGGAIYHRGGDVLIQGYDANSRVEFNNNSTDATGIAYATVDGDAVDGDRHRHNFDLLTRRRPVRRQRLR